MCNDGTGKKWYYNGQDRDLGHENNIDINGIVYTTTRSPVYKKRSKNMSSLDFDFLYSCFLFLMVHFG